MYTPLLKQSELEGDNFMALLSKFIESWYEIQLSYHSPNINFSEIYKIDISEEVNSFLNFLISLTLNTTNGIKNKYYSCYDFFIKGKDCPLSISYIPQEDAIQFAKQPYQPLYYVILDYYGKDPMIYTTQDWNTYAEQGSLKEFLLKHIFGDSSKPKVKSFIEIYKDIREKEEIAKKLTMIFSNTIKYKNIYLFERDDSIAAIYPSSDIWILSVGRWEQKTDIYSKEICNLLGHNGWSNNTHRYKL